MGSYRMDPKKQFSKRLARWTAVFWFFYMTWLTVLMMLQPAVAQYSFYMGLIATVTMMVNVVSYTANSIQEKILLTAIEKTQIQVGFKSSKASANSSVEGEEDEDGNCG